MIYIICVWCLIYMMFRSGDTIVSIISAAQLLLCQLHVLYNYYCFNYICCTITIETIWNNLKQFETIYFHKTWYRIYMLHWNIIQKSTGVTWNVGPYKLIRLPGHPNLNLNLNIIKYNKYKIYCVNCICCTITIVSITSGDTICQFFRFCIHDAQYLWLVRWYTMFMSGIHDTQYLCPDITSLILCIVIPYSIRFIGI